MGAVSEDSGIRALSVSGCQGLFGAVRESPGQQVLSENVGAAVLGGKVPVVSNPFVLTQLVQRGDLPGEPLVRAVEARQIDLIVMARTPKTIQALGSERWWGRLVAAIEENYQVARVYDCADGNVVLEPKPAARPTPAAGRGNQP